MQCCVVDWTVHHHLSSADICGWYNAYILPFSIAITPETPLVNPSIQCYALVALQPEKSLIVIGKSESTLGSILDGHEVLHFLPAFAVVIEQLMGHAPLQKNQSVPFSTLRCTYLMQGFFFFPFQ